MKHLKVLLLLCIVISCKNDKDTLSDKINYLKFTLHNSPRDTSKPILILNLNQTLDSESLSEISKEISDFFVVKTTTQQQEVDFTKITTRIQKDTLQYAADDFLKFLNINLASENQLCKVALIHKDLYPHNSWNFCYGKADFDTHCAVVSNFRLKTNDELINTIIHEICHTLGLEHCPITNCIMHAAKDLKETQLRGNTLCGLCQKKLNYVLGKNLMEK
jgi:predicted Zn-dependent protease